ncbi:uncharacterized protein PITG_15236 [Phytophthora infestans T30-4]|uniref:Uncharacterized protein n=1 Tax=Phytophthora infestans (strain T30-4) TaxID=403677 RepID=D0NQ77_PHYIT|nr:uncharacterized protein PITG_15236 [Phytophthora infestans T30-4]EEY62809.1 hypothetical protein PITG_15236 [Phytophthora infestans T30-4]|eukprot:XP_002898684.1 hypothetical protein PITG_15236 [Phytophthora infestans T30-4]
MSPSYRRESANVAVLEPANNSSPLKVRSSSKANTEDGTREEVGTSSKRINSSGEAAKEAATRG